MNDSPQKVSVLRRMLGIGQKSIAADLKVAQETISKWELGKMPIPKNRVDALARCLGCEPADFKNLPLADLAAKVADKISPPPSRSLIEGALFKIQTTILCRKLSSSSSSSSPPTSPLAPKMSILVRPEHF